MDPMTLAIVGLLLILFFTVFTGAPYLPSKKTDLRQAFSKLYPLSEADTLVDLGSGDGIVLREARRFGATAIGYEIGPIYVLASRLLARGDSQQRVLMKNYWTADFPEQTTVLYAFSDSRDIKKLYKLCQEQARKLRKPLFLISYGIAVPDIQPENTQGAHYLYKLPDHLPE